MQESFVFQSISQAYCIQVRNLHANWPWQNQHRNAWSDIGKLTKQVRTQFGIKRMRSGSGNTSTDFLSLKTYKKLPSRSLFPISLFTFFEKSVMYGQV